MPFSLTPKLENKTFDINIPVTTFKVTSINNIISNISINLALKLVCLKFLHTNLTHLILIALCIINTNLN